jgi:hypothetical protein
MPAACGLLLAAHFCRPSSLCMDPVGPDPPSFSPRRAPFKREKVAAATLVPRATVCSANCAHATPDAPPPYHASAPHCRSVIEATGFEAAATSASPVSSSN